MALPHITDVKGIGQSTAEILSEHDVNTVEDLARIDIDLLIALPGFSGIRAAKVINEAQALLGTGKMVGVVQPVAMESSDRAALASAADPAELGKLELSKKTKKRKQAKKPKGKKKKKLKPEQKKKPGKGKKSKAKDKKKK